MSIWGFLRKENATVMEVNAPYEVFISYAIANRDSS